MTRIYRAFGLTLSSDIFLPELVPSPQGAIDLTIRRGPVAADHLTGQNFAQDFGDDHAVLYWKTVGAFHIDAQGNITVDAFPNLSDDLIAFPLLGPVMAIALQYRGAFVLHAGAVSINDQAVVFMGDKMAGKSTTTAAFVRAGHKMLSDDLAPIRFDTAGQPVIAPAFAQVKLSDDARQAIALSDAVARPDVHEVIEKKRQLLSSAFENRTMPLAALYVLERGTQAQITTLQGQNALAMLLRFAYAPRFGTDFLSGPVAKRHFEMAASLARQVPVCILQVPTGLDKLHQVVDLLQTRVPKRGQVA
ncbi:serine kinase [Pseudaestuariivita rosea]|uniref:serine kinase n=1 Tax=Pseudaestuariivita rosea TaxID=2763263 RepID=UPI001ABA71C8|nr:serine kinase [Pseudaestuariivita rosea]